jgi:hypothetical protein
MRTYKSILGCIAGSVIITLVTGLVMTPGASLIGGTGYGLPMTWITSGVLTPQYAPGFLSVTGIIVDLVIWFVILEILCLAGDSLSRGKKPAPKPRNAKRRRR